MSYYDPESQLQLMRPPIAARIPFRYKAFVAGLAALGISLPNPYAAYKSWRYKYRGDDWQGNFEQFVKENPGVKIVSSKKIKSGRGKMQNPPTPRKTPSKNTGRVSKKRKRAGASSGRSYYRGKRVFSFDELKRISQVRRMLRRGVGGTAQSDGKFVTTKSFKRSYKNRLAKTGVSVVTESNILFNSSPDLQVVGHATTPSNSVKYVLFKMLIVKMMQKQHILVEQFNEDLFPVGSIWTVEYQIRPETPPSSVPFTMVGGAGNLSPQALLNWLMDPLREWNVGVSFANDLFLTSFSYSPPVGYDRIAPPFTQLFLNNMYVNLHCKSDMKIQNQTVKDATDTNAEDIDNVPLYGKCMDYKGTALVNRNPLLGSVLGANSTTGLSDGFAIDFGSEPPLPSQFTNVRRVGKVHLAPGELKTSVIQTKMRGSFSYLLNLFASYQPLVTTRRRVGYSRAFFIEKMVNSSAQNIRLQVEINLRITANAKYVEQFPFVQQLIKI